MIKLFKNLQRLGVAFCCVSLLALTACGNGGDENNTDNGEHTAVPEDDGLCPCCLEEETCTAIISLVPLGGIKDNVVRNLQKDLEKQLGSMHKPKPGKENFPVGYRVEIMSKDRLPDSCLNNGKTRYRADKLLRFLKQKYGAEGTYIIGVTDKDISTSVHDKEDYGIMGLSYMPGNFSIISTHRAKSRNNLWKLAVHEFCHGFFGMPHCPNRDPKCLMKDAEGGSPHFELKESFCETCMGSFPEF